MKEIKIKLNTKEGQDSFKTNRITGKLDAVIVDINKFNVELIIESDLGYLILQRKKLEGTQYLVPRTRTTTPIEDLKDFPGYEKFNLNEKIIITIIGPKDIEVNLIFRID